MTVLTTHCVTALERVRMNLAMPSPEQGSALLPGHKQYICLALDWEEHEDSTFAPACDHLRRVIQERLHPQGCLENWLVTHVPEADQLSHQNQAAFDLRTYHTRLAWIDSLITELLEGEL